ncbi:MAG: hypothetical protein WCK64_02885 [Synechococcaceae cyanobacterium ELA445]
MRAPSTRHLLLPLAASALALLVWLPLGGAGVPLDTPDGFLHLGWAVGWARQVAGGWWWPEWSDLNWAGAGTFALAIYPPLFRLLVGLPLLTGVPADIALAGALLVVLLVNAAGGLALAKVWLRPGGWRWLLVISATLNPYLLVNVYVRGAWPEALAQGWLWWLAVGLVGIHHQRHWALWITAMAISGVVLSNWNAALLLFILWGVGAVGLAASRKWPLLMKWLLGLLLGLAVTAPFWLPALLMLKGVRPPIPAGLFPGEFFLAGEAGVGSFAQLLWIQAVVLGLLIVARWLAWGHRSGWLGVWGLAIALLGLALMLPISQPVYGLVPPLQRIQFPWRWLGPAWFGSLLWLCSPGARAVGANAQGIWRRLLLTLVCAAAGAGWFDALWRFRTNLVGHAPASEDRHALMKLLACDPLEPCPEGIAALPVHGELAKRFAALPDGRIALAGVPDYSPAGIPEGSWQKRLQTFWVPTWPQASWARFSGKGSVTILSHSPRQRTLLVQAMSPGTLRLMQWAHPQWRVQLRQANAISGPWSAPIAAGARDADGWISIPVNTGRWEVALTYGQSR